MDESKTLNNISDTFEQTRLKERLRNVKEELARVDIGTVNLLENIRFYPEEEKNDLKLAKELAVIADVYVNDAFGVAHRNNISTVGIARYLPAVAGLLMEKEVEMIEKAINQPKQPLVVIIGGAKVKTKMVLLEKLLGKAESILFGGVIANTFLKAQGYEMGRSLVDEGMKQQAKKILRMAKQSKTKISLPVDMVVGDLDKNQYQGVVKVSEIPGKLQALDIGPKTQAIFGKTILSAETIIWNGPMGVHENPKFAIGTAYVYQMIAENRGSLSIVGGGDTLTALKNEDYLETIDNVSTGGGAMLELIERGTLPGVEGLMNL